MGLRRRGAGTGLAMVGLGLSPDDALLRIDPTASIAEALRTYCGRK